MSLKPCPTSKVLSVLLALSLLLCMSACSSSPSGSAGSSSSAPSAGTGTGPGSGTGTQAPSAPAGTFTLDSVPEWSEGTPWVEINGNRPFFTDEELSSRSTEQYSPLDSLGRCGTAYAVVGTDLMPTEDRGSIGSVKPSGWQSVKYDFVDGRYLYNRCHLIGYQLTAENANEENLITGTRYLNIEGMLPFENMVADFVKETDSHVAYRVTPVFAGDELVARGVLMEGQSVEDGGEGICFCVFAYNVQPGVAIDYATGESTAAENPSGSTGGEVLTYVLNTSSMKFHLPDCPSAQGMSENNREEFTGTRSELIDAGYTPCGVCKP